MTHGRVWQCDASDWQFAVFRDDAELVAVLYHRNERYGPEFRAPDQQELQARIARWLLLHAERAGGLQ